MGTGLISEKTEVLYAELMKERKHPSVVSGDFLQYIYSVLVTKNHRNIWIYVLTQVMWRCGQIIPKGKAKFVE